MKRIAVILTCHNRKNKTLLCLRHLFAAYELYINDLALSIYLTDDGCTDGTAEAVANEFSDRDIHILKGTGSLYWAGGMRIAWVEALKGIYDGYLLLNDDTLVLSNVFLEISDAHAHCLKSFNTGGIYIGTTCSPENQNNITYGGTVILNRWKLTRKRVIPNGRTPQNCDLGNANIMLVSADAVQKLGTFHDAFTHGGADYDYTLLAKKKRIPVLVTSNVCGTCERDHHFDFNLFANKSLKDRIEFAFSPKGFAFSNYLKYMRRNFWYRLPFVVIMGWTRILFPRISRMLKKTVDV